MDGVDQAAVKITNSTGASVGTVSVRLLPQISKNQKPIPLLDYSRSQNPEEELERVQLLEGYEYLYDVSLELPGQRDGLQITTDKREIFQADTKEGIRGRLKTGLHTGALPVTIFQDGVEIGRVSFEVRSRKLDYKSHYRWMLGDIAKELTEIIMERFAPSEQAFQLNENLDAPTLYQRFAFLQSLITDDLFYAAIQQVLSRPHHIWAIEPELRYPGQQVPASSNVARQLGKPGRKVKWDDHPMISHLPEKILIERTENSVDTPPNRFIKFALARWRSVVAEIDTILANENGAAPIERGRREVQIVLDKLDALLSEELFREVGPLTHFPADNQVLQKREGYRDIFLAYIQFEAAALLSWEGGENVYSAGQKNVATLYEYWTFMKLAKIVAEICDVPFDFGDLLKTDVHKLSVDLKKGKQKVLKGKVEKNGRMLGVELYFNRTFGSRGGSWSKQMVPDCSLAIIPDKNSSPELDEVWVHFDAKYRVENLKQIFGDDTEGNGEGNSDDIKGPMILGEAKRDDLLKMHAYRDAIKRTAGAYVLYPGDSGEKEDLYEEYHEILPGLGAFTLRPTDHDEAFGTQPLARFIKDVINHVSSQLSQHERGRYWLKESYTDEPITRKKVNAAPFLKQPAADTTVLVGYVKNRKHHAWIADKGLYNMRGDDRRGKVEIGSRELGVDLLVIYSDRENIIELREIAGDPMVMTKKDMIALAYPDTKGELYWCLPVGPDVHERWNKEITFECIERVRSENAPDRDPNGPFTTTWLDLFGE